MVSRFLATGAFYVVGVLASVVLASSATDRPSSCAALRAWAQPYADKSPTLAELTAFDGGHQRAIFAALTPAARVSLWREHLGVLAEWPEFTPAQRVAAEELRGVVVPEIYKRGSAARERALSLWKAREALFSPAQRRAFLVLGASPAASAAQTTWCDCEPTYGQVQCYPLVCGPPHGCFGQDGCGFSGTLECTRQCQ
jgi:hypothetical protein